MIEQVLSVTDAVRNFSDLINRVYYQHQSYLLTRGGVVVARLTTPHKTLTGAELVRRWPKEPPLTEEEAAVWAEEFAALKRTIGPPSGHADEWDF